MYDVELCSKTQFYIKKENISTRNDLLFYIRLKIQFKMQFLNQKLFFLFNIWCRILFEETVLS